MHIVSRRSLEAFLPFQGRALERGDGWRGGRQVIRPAVRIRPRRVAEQAGGFTASGLVEGPNALSEAGSLTILPATRSAEASEVEGRPCRPEPVRLRRRFLDSRRWGVRGRQRGFGRGGWRGGQRGGQKGGRRGVSAAGRRRVGGGLAAGWRRVGGGSAAGWRRAPRRGRLDRLGGFAGASRLTGARPAGTLTPLPSGLGRVSRHSQRPGPPLDRARKVHSRREGKKPNKSLGLTSGVFYNRDLVPS